MHPDVLTSAVQCRRSTNNPQPTTNNPRNRESVRAIAGINGAENIPGLETVQLIIANYLFSDSPDQKTLLSDHGKFCEL
jgi:hypothetical protein